MLKFALKGRCLMEWIKSHFFPNKVSYTLVNTKKEDDGGTEEINFWLQQNPLPENLAHQPNEVIQKFVQKLMKELPYTKVTDANQQLVTTHLVKFVKTSSVTHHAITTYLQKIKFPATVSADYKKSLGLILRNTFLDPTPLLPDSTVLALRKEFYLKHKNFLDK